MRAISKSFPGVRALSRVDLTIHAGEVHALMGENGAGKSTLIKILSGAYQADGGDILIDGKPVRITGPLAAKALGIAVIYQELALAPNLTVAENIHLGSEVRTRGLVDRSAMRDAAQPVLKRLGAGFGPGTLVADLSIAQRQMVEIARAVHARSRILVMDEPTTALSSRETEKLFATVRQLRAEGLAIIYISHRMNEVYELADRVSVLRDGVHVGTLNSRAEATPETIVKMMVGRDLSSFYKKAHGGETISGAPVLDVRNLSDGGRVKDASFALHAGEVLGLAGLVGAGRTELAMALFGAAPKATGTILLDGTPVQIRKPQDAIDRGIAYLTEDRKATGLFLDMSVSENVNLAVIGRDASRLGILDRARAKLRAAAAIAALNIRVAGPQVPVGALSGGNQQKVLLSRLLETKPRILILDEPTRGVDIGAKSEIYRIIDSLAKAGVAVLVISSELPEIVGIADRVLVMREGVIEGEVGRGTGRDINEVNIMAFATGTHRAAA